MLRWPLASLYPSNFKKIFSTQFVADIKSEPYRREDTRNYLKKSRTDANRMAQLATVL